MIDFVAVLFVLLSIYGQGTTYYVDMKGTDDIYCGSQTSPCASINQVFINNPAASYTVSIGNGSFPTTNIFLTSSIIIFQGTGNTVIIASWRWDFITLDDSSGFEFHNVNLVLPNGGEDFVTMNASNNVVGFYDVILTYANYSGDFVYVYGGSLFLTNFTFNKADFSSCLIFDQATQFPTNISILNSTFSNLNMHDDAYLIQLTTNRTANFVLDSSIFTYINASYTCTFWTISSEQQQFKITNNVYSHIFIIQHPFFIIEHFNYPVVYVQNCTWNNVTSLEIAPALGISLLANENKVDNDILLDQLTITNCSGYWSGGLYFSDESVGLTNSSFADNDGNVYANDVVIYFSSSDFVSYYIADSYSSSASPKAVILYSDGSTDDISDQLPTPPNEPHNPSRFVPLRTLKRIDDHFATEKTKKDKS